MIAGPANFLLRLVLIAATLVVWEGLVRLLQIPAFILPTPSNIFMALYRGTVSALYVDHFPCSRRCSDSRSARSSPSCSASRSP